MDVHITLHNVIDIFPVYSQLSLLNNHYHEVNQVISVHSFQMFSQASHVVPLSLLHSVLLHRQLYIPATFSAFSHWSAIDSSMSVDLLRMIVTLCQRHKGVSEACKHIYGGHCVDLIDKATVDAICEALILPPKQIKAVGSL